MTGESSRRRPRILYVLTSDMSVTFVRGQLAAVRRSGFDVHLAANWISDERLVDEGVETWHIPFAREPDARSDLRTFRSCVALIRRLRPDIVHAGTPKAGLLSMVAAWVCRVPTRIYALHGLRYETAEGISRGIYKTAERAAAACSTLVICDSESMRERSVDDRLVRARKIIVIGHGSANGVYTRRFSPAIDQPTALRRLGMTDFETVIGFVGRLTRDKGIDDLVEVFLERFDGRPEVGLLLVGPLEDGDPIDQSTRKQISHSNQVIHISWLDDPVDAYAAMDILAFPSYREGLPNVPLEAQAAGVPVVGYASTGTVDAVDSRSLVDIGDRQRFGDMLVELTKDVTARQSAGRSARMFVSQRFEQQDVWARRIDVFWSLLKPNFDRPPEGSTSGT